MKRIERTLSMLTQQVQGPRGGRYVMLGGALLMIFACIAVQISSAIAEASPAESTGAFVAGVILSIAFVALIVGIVLAVIGAVMHIFQSARARMPME